MKTQFINYIGPRDNLNSYQRSYKLVFFKSLFELLDDEGKVSEYALAENFKKFYLNRKQQGKKPDMNVDPRIENIEQSSTNDILRVIVENPYKAISDKGFISRKTISDQDYFVLAPQLFDELTPDDILKINEIVDAKIVLYFSRSDSGALANDLSSMFRIILSDYAAIRDTQPFAGNSMGELFRKKLPDYISELAFIDPQKHRIKGSVELPPVFVPITMLVRNSSMSGNRSGA